MEVDVWLYSFLTTAIEGGEGLASRPGRSLLPGKTRYQLYRRLGGLQGRSGEVRKISPPPGFDLRTVQPVASRYTDWATRPTQHEAAESKITYKQAYNSYIYRSNSRSNSVYFFETKFKILTQFVLEFGLLSLTFSNQLLHFLPPHAYAESGSPQILHIITLISCDEDDELQNTSYNFLRPLVSLFLTGSHILLSILFSNFKYALYLRARNVHTE